MADEAYRGFVNSGTRGNEFSALQFMIDQTVARTATATLVRVVSVTVNDVVGPVGMLAAVPMIAQVDGNGKTTPHGTIYNMPYQRMQGGVNAVIMDPKAGDIGIAVFASRDITAVKKTKKDGPPGSKRRNDYSDGMYVGGLLNGTPTQYVRFTDDFVEIVSTKEIKMKAPKLTFDGDLTVTGGVKAGQGTGDSVTLQHHKHTVGGPEPVAGT